MAGLWPLRTFFFGLAAALFLALVAPEVGASGGVLRTQHLTGWAVALIFLIQGLQLPASEVKRGVFFWRVHLFCQLWMFVVFPLMGWMVVSVAGEALDPVARTGLLYLCILPTTVATNAAFSQRAGGHGAVALFNIVAGNFIGVFIAPLFLTWLLQKETGTSADLRPLIQALMLQLIIPFAVGQVVRLRFADVIDPRKGILRELGSVLIFFIIYVSVCNLVTGQKGAVSWESTGPVVAATLALLVFGKALCWQALRVTGWSHDIRVAAFYSASQKTLAAGLPIAGAVYAAAGPVNDFPPLALLALPLILFHIGQLVLGALLIPVLAGRGSHSPCGR
jgi:solute carrier family 10 (sodium/bile acid cotransporter), member 7